MCRCVFLGCDCLPWLGYIDKLGPAAEFSISPYGEDAQSSRSPFPVAPADKRSYAQNCVVWTKNAGLQVVVVAMNIIKVAILQYMLQDHHTNVTIKTV